MKARGWLATAWCRSLVVLVGLVTACGPASPGPTGPEDQPKTIRFLDPEFGVEVDRGIVYSTGAVRRPSVGELDLLLDVYRPANADQPAIRPGLVLIHGGGFTGGSRTNSTMVTLGTTYAERGYVAVSIEYRMVRDDPPTEELSQSPTNPVSVAAAAARVDAARAVDWMRANAASYRIDPNRIAVGGYSAGAITAMSMGFLDPGIGGAEVQAVLSFSGGLYGAESIIDADDPPLIMIHGTADGVVPFSLAAAIEARALFVGLVHEFYRLDGVGHGSPQQLGAMIEGITLADRITNFFHAHLRLDGL